SHSRRGNEQIDDNMLKLHASEMQCSLGTLKSLLQNPKSKDAYFSELLKKGLINQKQYEAFCRRKNSKTKR
ncbi:MAG TPA: hypothetical protein VEP90_02465, partial [Methylomirabilota bacterium]|nr:hypothetical protein [Methylomirabilota bacterium]